MIKLGQSRPKSESIIIIANDDEQSNNIYELIILINDFKQQQL